MKKIGCIGCGNMGGALASAIAKTENALYLADADAAKASALAERLGATCLSVEDLVFQCDMVLIGVKPQVFHDAVFDICEELGIPCIEKVMNRFDVLSSDECFLTGTAAEVIAATSLDGRKIGSGVAGPITGRILARFRTLVRE